MDDEKESKRGYVYGNQIFPEGTIVDILEHARCPGAEGIVKQKLPDIFYIACLTCHRDGMILKPGIASHE